MLADDSLTVLAAAGGAAVAAAMTTGTWPGPEGQASLRAGKGLASLRELDLILPLKEHPEAEAELREHVAAIGTARPAKRQRRCAG